MSLIVGIDWSTKALHAALIPLDDDHGDKTMPEVTFRSQQLEGKNLERIRSVRSAMKDLLAPVTQYVASETGPSVAHQYTVSAVVIEEAWGSFGNVNRALLPLFGAITSGVSGKMWVDSMSAKQWRAELGIDQRGGKEASLVAANQYLKTLRLPVVEDEHFAEALLVALAGRQRNWRTWEAGHAV